jgi:cytidylate kinase
VSCDQNWTLSVGFNDGDALTFRGVVALDGPSGTGKSTVARRLAARLGTRYLDTGAMYRAATVAVLNAAVDPADSDAVVAEVSSSLIQVSTNPTLSRTTLNGRNVDADIRSPATTAAVSAVSAVPSVRSQLVAQQRAIICIGPIVAEGRDIGSVVWPDAEVKVYLTASEAVRARRRAGELGIESVAAISEALRRRDAFDSSRAVGPLRRADGSTEVDTSELSIDEVVDVLEGLARRAVGAANFG